MSLPREFRILREIGWLTETPRAFRDAVLGRCIPKRFARGESVYRAGDPPGGLYGLIEGGIAVELAPEESEPYLGTFVRPGFWIGEAGVQARLPRAVGIRATRDSLLAHLPLAQWDLIVQADPGAWRWLGQLILRNELLALGIADALMVRRAPARVAAILSVLARQELVAPGGPVDLAVSQDDLARITNLSRSSVGRILAGFEADGLIAGGYRQVRVLDLAGLRDRRTAPKAEGGGP